MIISILRVEHAHSTRPWGTILAFVACVLASSSSQDASAAIRKSWNLTRGSNVLVAQCNESVKNVPVECPDAAVMHDEGAGLIQLAFEQSDFEKLDSTFNQWCSGEDRFGDGTWKLASFTDGLRRAYTADRAQKLKAWQQLKPTSYAPKFAQVEMWRHNAWAGRVNSTAPRTKEGQAIFAQSLAKAIAILREIEAMSGTCPAWYPLQIKVLIDQGKTAEARRVFDKGVARFPQFHELYFAMARAYEPGWGGSTAAYGAFADESVKLAKGFEGSSMYARIHLLVDDGSALPFDAEDPASPPWSKLKAGFDALIKTYPSSYIHANDFAYVGCRSNDSTLYRQLRSKAHLYLSGKFAEVSDICDRRHNWTAGDADVSK